MLKFQGTITFTLVQFTLWALCRSRLAFVTLNSLINQFTLFVELGFGEILTEIPLLGSFKYLWQILFHPAYRLIFEGWGLRDFYELEKIHEARFIKCSQYKEEFNPSSKMLLSTYHDICKTNLELLNRYSCYFG